MEMLRKIWTPVLKLISSVWLCSGLIVMTWSLGCIYFVLGSWRKTAFAAFSVCGKLPVTALPSSLNCFWASYTKNTFSLVWSGWSCGFFCTMTVDVKWPILPCRSSCTRCSTGSSSSKSILPHPIPIELSTHHTPRCLASTLAGWWCPLTWTLAWLRVALLWISTLQPFTLQVRYSQCFPLS